MFVVRLIAAASVATSLAACAGTPETGQGPKENTGTLVGAVAGGLVGSQFGGGTGERIAAAHADGADHAPGSPLLQIGMDTPQVTAANLAEALAPLSAAVGPDAVLGPAADGGWWALGLRDPRAAKAIASVPTSRPDTGEATLRALRAAGLSVAVLPELRDVDTAEDALAVAAAGAGRRFSAEVAALLSRPAGVAR